MGGRHRRRAARAALLVLVAIPLAVAAAPDAHNDDDPRNGIGGESRITPDCLACHRPEGMYDSHIVLADPPRMLKVGEPADVPVRVDNPWKARVTGIHASVALPGGDNPVRVPGADAGRVADVYEHRGNLSSKVFRNAATGQDLPSEALETFLVGPDPLRIEVLLELYPVAVDGVESAKEIHVESALLSADNTRLGNWTPADTDAIVRRAVVDSDLASPGVWTLRLRYTSGQPLQVDYYAHILVTYGSPTGLSFQLPSSDSGIPAFSSESLPLRVVGEREGRWPLEIEVRASIYYRHGTTAGYDYDNYTRFRTLELVVGDEYVASEGLAPAAVLVPRSAWTIAWGEVSGIASAALLPPALLVGGSFGRGSRQFFNAVFGGAKRRVMFHSTVSLGLTLAALVHIALFFIEARYGVTVGLLWGGLGAVCLLGLALTGYYQVPFIQRHGYGWWRGVHLAFGLFVMVFVALHAGIDGDDFAAVKDSLPDWITRWRL